LINGATTTPLTITVQDADGNSSTCLMNVITVDTLVPTVTNCPTNQTVNAGSTDCLFALGDYSTGIIATDGCGGALTYTQFPSIGTTISAGTAQSVSVSVEDVSGNVSTCDFILTVQDVTAPNLICPLNPSVNTNNICQYELPDYQSQLSVTDNCGVISNFTQSPVVGTVLSGDGTQQLISLFATDQYGNVSSCSFTITLEDATPPTITCPGTQAIAINANCQYTIPDFSSLVITNDFCDANPVITQSPQVGTVLSGINTVTITATDANGNASSCTFQAEPLDTESPSITCPGDIIQCDSLVNYSIPIGFDNCGLVTVTQSDVSGLTSGDVFPVGTTTQSFVASDIVGNTQQCSFTITIHPPVTVSLPTTQTIEEGDTVNLNALITNGSEFIWTPDFYLSNDTIMSPDANPTLTMTYTVNVTSENGCIGSGTTTVVVNEIDELVINNFLSPNGDGKNDTWNVNKPSLISGCNVSIFDRWGKKVWGTDLYQNNWRGTNQEDADLPDGTYFYSIKCAGKDEIKGTILLLR
jgi:gliding motility-associated-like protein